MQSAALGCARLRSGNASAIGSKPLPFRVINRCRRWNLGGKQSAGIVLFCLFPARGCFMQPEQWGTARFLNPDRQMGSVFAWGAGAARVILAIPPWVSLLGHCSTRLSGFFIFYFSFFIFHFHRHRSRSRLHGFRQLTIRLGPKYGCPAIRFSRKGRRSMRACGHSCAVRWHTSRGLACKTRHTWRGNVYKMLPGTVT